MRSRADLYDWELTHVHGRQDQDVAFYLDVVPAGGRVLELACGTGRVASRLAAAGCDVVGIDLDGEMLAGARRRGLTKLVRADMRAFALAARFDAVLVPYNSLQLLPDDDAVVACLQSAAAHLVDGGVLAFEVTPFDAPASTGPELVAEADGVRLTGSLEVDGGRLHYHRRFEEGGQAYEDTVTLRNLDVPTLTAAAGPPLRFSGEKGRCTALVCRRSGGGAAQPRPLRPPRRARRRDDASST